MATGASQNVTITITTVMQGTPAAIQQVNALNRTVGQTTQRTRRARRAFGQFHSIVGTLVKALISMIGVLIAFNLLITIPEKIIQGIVIGTIAAIKAIGEFEERVVGLQAVLASVVIFDEDPVKNFTKAGQVALAVMDELLQRNKEINGTIEEAATVFQILVTSGVGNYVKNVGQAVDLTILLTNAIGAVAVGTNRMKQFVQETKALMQGQVDPASMLARLLFSSSEELKNFLASAKDSKDLLEKMEKRLFGFVAAVQPMSRTMSNIVGSLKDMGTTIARSGLYNFFDLLRERVIAFRDGVFDASNKMTGLSKAADQAAATVGASITVAFEVLLKTFGLLDQTADGFMLSVTSGMPNIVEEFARWATILKNIFNFFKGVIKIVVNLFMIAISMIIILKEELTKVFNIGMAIVEGWRTGDWVGSLKRAVTANKELNTGFDRMKDALVGITYGLEDIVDMEDAALNAEMARLRVQEEINIINARNANNAQDRRKLLEEVLRTNNEINKTETKGLDIVERLRQEYALARAGNDEVLKVTIQRVFKERELRNQLKEQPALLKEALELNRKLFEIEAKRAVQQMAVARARERLGELKEYGGTQQEIRTASITAAIAEALAEGKDPVRKWMMEVEKFMKEDLVAATQKWLAEVETVGGVLNRLQFDLDRARAAGDPFKVLLLDYKKAAADVALELALYEYALADALDILNEMYRIEKERLEVQNLVRYGRLFEEAMKNAADIMDIAMARAERTGASLDFAGWAEAGREIAATWEANNQLIVQGEAHLQALKEAMDLAVLPEDIIALSEAYEELWIRIEDLKLSQQELQELGRAFVESNVILATSLRGLSDAMADIVSGAATVGEAFKKMAAAVLMAIADLIMAYGFALVGQGWLFSRPDQIAMGIAMVALSGVIRGLAQILGGGGGGANASVPGGTPEEARPAPQFVSQADIAAQQGLNAMLDDNIKAIRGLRDEVSRLSKETGDVLVTNAVSRNVSTITRTVSTHAASSYSSSRQLGGALVGEPG